MFQPGAEHASERHPLCEVIELAGVSAYMLGAAALLRARGRLQPATPLTRAAARRARVGLARALGAPRGGDLADVQRVAGHAYCARLPRLLAAPSDAEGRSCLVVLEDGRPLGPAHSAHADIEARGAGAFSHWLDHAVFSSSDNTDPRSNGRRYEFVLHE